MRNLRGTCFKQIWIRWFTKTKHVITLMQNLPYICSLKWAWKYCTGGTFCMIDLNANCVVFHINAFATFAAALSGNNANYLFRWHAGTFCRAALNSLLLLLFYKPRIGSTVGSCLWNFFLKYSEMFLLVPSATLLTLSHTVVFSYVLQNPSWESNRF